MNILYITNYTEMYGANKSMFDLAVAVNSQEGCTAAVVLPGECELSKLLSDNNVKCIFCPITTWQAVFAGRIRFEIKKMIRKNRIRKEYNKLFNLLKDEKIDIIHSNSSAIGIGAMLAKTLGVKHVWHIREFSKEHYNMEYFYKDSYVKEFYEAADCLITISEALTENYKKKYPKAVIKRVYNGLKLKDVPVRIYEHKDTLNMVYTGYVFPKKHQLEVVKYCKRMIDDGFDSFNMYFYGDGKESYVKEIKSYIAGNDLDKHVHFMGYVNNADENIKNMDVGIIASEYEAFGRVTVEYMMNYLPVIAYDDAGNKELVVNGETGILYKTEEEFIDAVKSLTDEKKREKMGMAGRERAIANYLSDKNLSGVTEIYELVLNKK